MEMEIDGHYLLNRRQLDSLELEVGRMEVGRGRMESGEVGGGALMLANASGAAQVSIRKNFDFFKRQ